MKKRIVTVLLFLHIFALYPQTFSPSLEHSVNLYDSYLQNGTQEIDEVIIALYTLEADFPTSFKTGHLYTEYLLYMKYITILSAYYADGNDSVYNVLKYSEDIAEEIVQNAPFSPYVMLAYTDYKVSTLMWDDNTFDTLKGLPTMYRRISLRCGDDEDLKQEVITKLTLWAALRADAETPNRNTFIEKNKELIQNLSEPDLFTAYIFLSFYYMKIYDVSSGWEYLDLAQNVYPNNTRVQRVIENYSKGIFSW